MYSGLHEVAYDKTWGYMWEAATQGYMSVYRVMYMELPKLNYPEIHSYANMRQHIAA